VGQVDKILLKMQNNPRDWRINSLKTVAKAYEMEWRQQGTSHVVFFDLMGKPCPFLPADRSSQFLSRNLSILCWINECEI
jgi:hypothetical protein